MNMANSNETTIRNAGLTPDGGLSGGGFTAFGPIAFVAAVDISVERCQEKYTSNTSNGISIGRQVLSEGEESQ